MRKLVFLGLAGAIALTVASCSSDSGSDVATSPSPVVSTGVKKPGTAQPFGAKASPLVAQKPPAGDTIPGLIQSTNGDERAKQVQASIDGQKGKDPFAGLPPKLQQPRTAVNTQTVPTVRQLPATPKSVTPKPTTTTTAFNPNNPKTPLPPQGKADVPVIKTLPPLPSTTLASAVEVSGVVMVGGVAQAIVKAPNEETSRYVRVGQRLSNGQVLVKRIEMNAGSDPIVVLEENGVEVSRAVGTAVAAANKPA